MSMKRMGRINEDVQRELAAIIRRVKDPRVPELLTVTRAEVTNDLSYANVYVSAFNVTETKDVLKGLKSASGYIRRELGSSLNLRHTPELIFHWDESFERGARIEQLLHEVRASETDNTGGAE